MHGCETKKSSKHRLILMSRSNSSTLQHSKCTLYEEAVCLFGWLGVSYWLVTALITSKQEPLTTTLPIVPAFTRMTTDTANNAWELKQLKPAVLRFKYTHVHTHTRALCSVYSYCWCGCWNSLCEVIDDWAPPKKTKKQKNKPLFQWLLAVLQ